MQPAQPLTGTRLRLAMVAISMGTFVSVVFGSIVNVPLRDIAADLHASIGQASLVVTGMSLSFGSLMPLGGWLGNRFGRQRVFVIGNAALAVIGVACTFAPDITTLVALRIVQGCFSATITPTVIAVLADLVSAADRPKALAGWAMANGLGQALGPPLGGILAGAFGWRSIFLPGVALAVACSALAARAVPADAPRPVPLEWRGALALTVAGLAFLGATSVVPQAGIAHPGVLAGLAVTVLALAAFAVASRRAEHPFVSPAVFREPSYQRACIGVATGTFALGVAFLDVPLLLTRGFGLSTPQAGLVAFALPVAMVVCAPFVGQIVRRTSSSAGLRTGLTVLATLGLVLAAWIRFAPGDGAAAALSIAVFVLLVFALGVGLSFVHNAAAVASTASPAARYGAGVGMFNLVRVAGTSLGTVVVAAVLERDPQAFAAPFAWAAVVAAGGFALMLLLPADGPPEATPSGAAPR